MNKDRLLMVANAIRYEKMNIKFDMGQWASLDTDVIEKHFTEDNLDTKLFNSEKNAYHCGTSACIAGFAVAMFAKDKFILRLKGRVADVFESAISIEDEAYGLLDLDYSEAQHLFYGRQVGLDRLQQDFVHNVPDALEWMAEKEIISWPQALYGVGAVTYEDRLEMEEDFY